MLNPVREELSLYNTGLLTRPPHTNTVVPAQTEAQQPPSGTDTLAHRSALRADRHHNKSPTSATATVVRTNAVSPPTPKQGLTGWITVHKPQKAGKRKKMKWFFLHPQFLFIYFT